MRQKLGRKSSPLRWTVLTGMALCLAGTAGIVETAQAQNAATPNAVAQQASEPERHLGTAEEAIVGVEVRDDNGALFGWGSGLVLRCDGFVAVPASICAYGKNSKLHLSIVLYPGTEKETRRPAPWPYYFGRVSPDNLSMFPMGYTVAHLPNVHQPALRVATSDVLNPGDEVELVWTQRDDKSGKFSPPQSKRVTLAEAKAYPKNMSNFLPGAVLLAESQPDVPAGATVAGPEGLGVGCVLREKADAPTSRFQSFSVLARVTNCVSPQMTTDAYFAGLHPEDSEASIANLAGKADQNDKKDAKKDKTKEPGKAKEADKEKKKPSGDMVAVPGGTVILPDVARGLQPDMGKTNTACVAPFMIDKYEVTNRQYFEFWKTLDDDIRKQKAVSKDYWPYGWAETDPPFPPEVANVPVIGVRITGALAYAKWQGKRLPTPAEWCLAAFGPKGMTEMPKWANAYVADRQATWADIWRAHSGYLARHPELIAPARRGIDGPLLPAQNGFGPHTKVPWLFPANVLINVRPDPFVQVDPNLFSQQVIDVATAHLWAKWNEPTNLLPIGARDYDKSPYGAMDMILNADELVWPGPDWPSGPSIVPDHYIHIGWQGIEAIVHEGKAAPQTSPPYDFHAGWNLDRNFINGLASNANATPDVGLYLTTLRASRFLSSEQVPAYAASFYLTNLLANLSIAEAAEIGRPVFYWRMRLVQGPIFPGTTFLLSQTMTADWFSGTLLPNLDAAPDTGNMGDAIRLWSRPPRFQRVEMGRRPSLSQPRTVGKADAGNAFVYTDEFVIAGGFRCVR